MVWRSNADNEIASVIAAQIGKPVVLTKWLLVVEYMDENGARLVAFNCAPDQRRTDSLGLIAYADAAERAGVAQDFEDEDA